MKTYKQAQKTKPNSIVGPIRRQIRICVACGNTKVEEYEFGISCEVCGTSFYFGRIYQTEKN